MLLSHRTYGGIAFLKLTFSPDINDKRRVSVASTWAGRGMAVLGSRDKCARVIVAFQLIISSYVFIDEIIDGRRYCNYPTSYAGKKK